MSESLPVLHVAAFESLGLRHGFFGRGSGRGFHSMVRGEAGPVEVACNRGRIVRHLGIRPEALTQAKQVHGRDLIEVTGLGQRQQWAQTAADALITRCPGVAVAVVTADCAPLLIADPETGWVGVAHLGRLGALAGLGGAVVRELCGRGAKLEDLVLAVGPHIQADSYEVGESLFSDLPEPAQYRNGQGKACCNLRSLITADLLAQGLSSHQISWQAEDTLTDSAYFSHRRDGAETGRQLSVIVAGADHA